VQRTAARIRHRGTDTTFDAARRDLVLLAVVVVGLSRLLDGPLAWIVAAFLLGAVLLGTLAVLGTPDAPDAERGVPIESLILPAVAAAGCLGAIQLVPVGVWLLPALGATALLIDRTVVLEGRLVVSDVGLTEEERSSVLIALLVTGFIAFVGVGALVPGGLAGAISPAGATGPVTPLRAADLLVLASADALIAGLLGYRAASLRMLNLRDALWSAATYAVAIAITAAALRAMALPRLVGPALLTLAFYLWDAIHGASPARRRDPSWIWQTAVLVVLGILVAGWNLMIRT
jgi:uncharacterized membrane protein YdcZ (DUF606 family)